MNAPRLTLAALACAAVALPAWAHADDDGAFSYGLILPGNHFVMATSEERWHSLDLAAKANPNREVYWFSIGEQAWLVRDSGQVAKAKAVVAPMEQLNARQGEIGREQGEISRQQARIDELKGRVDQLKARWDQVLSTMMLAANGGSFQRERAEAREAIIQLESQVATLERARAPLSRRMAEIGRAQDQLNDDQARVNREVRAGLRRIGDESIAKGLAERAPD